RCFARPLHTKWHCAGCAEKQRATSRRRANCKSWKKGGPGRPPKGANVWPVAHVALLGTDTDRAIAKRIGRGASAVRGKRVALGIVAFARSKRERPAPLFWDGRPMLLPGANGT